MANKNPKTKQIEQFQFSMVGEQPLASRVIGVRFSQVVTAELEKMNSSDRQQYIRQAVERRLQEDGKLNPEGM